MREKYELLSNRLNRLRTEVGEIEAEMKPFGVVERGRGPREYRRLNDRRINLMVEIKQLEPDVLVLERTVKSMRRI